MLTCCCVPQCKKRGGHTFPLDPEQGQQWVKAIKQLAEVTLRDWEATPLLWFANRISSRTITFRQSRQVSFIFMMLRCLFATKRIGVLTL